MDTIQDNGWNEMKNLVVSELKRMNTNYESLDGKVDNITIKVGIMNSKLECLPDHTNRINALETNQSALKVKSEIWGVIGGALPVIILIFIYIVVKGI